MVTWKSMPDAVLDVAREMVHRGTFAQSFVALRAEEVGKDQAYLPGISIEPWLHPDMVEGFVAHINGTLAQAGNTVEAVGLLLLGNMVLLPPDATEEDKAEATQDIILARQGVSKAQVQDVVAVACFHRLGEALFKTAQLEQHGEQWKLGEVRTIEQEQTMELVGLLRPAPWGTTADQVGHA